MIGRDKFHVVKINPKWFLSITYLIKWVTSITLF